MVYCDEIEDKIDLISEALLDKYPQIPNLRWCAIKLLEQDKELMKKYPLDLSGIIDRSYESDIINEKYEFIEEIVSEVLVNKAEKAETTNKADRASYAPGIRDPDISCHYGICFRINVYIR